MFSACKELCVLKTNIYYGLRLDVVSTLNFEGSHPYNCKDPMQNVIAPAALTFLACTNFQK